MSERPHPLASVRRFYALLLDELEHAGYDADEKALLAHPHHYYGRYVNPRTRPYVEHAILPRVADALTFFGLPRESPLRILDVGCGLGMQSLIFASLGATVVGVDVREESVLLCRKRKAYYERTLGRTLDLEFRLGDFGRLEAESFGAKFDGLFSMSAFSYVKPLERTAQRVSAALAPNAKVFLYEENATYLRDVKRIEPIPTPQTVASALASEGFRIEFLRGAGSIPNPLWRWPALNGTVMAPANELLRRNLRLSFSYILGMKRGS